MNVSHFKRFMLGLLVVSLMSACAGQQNETTPIPDRPAMVNATMVIAAQTITSEYAKRLNADMTAFTTSLSNMEITANGFSSSIVPDYLADGAIPSRLVLQKDNLTPVNAPQNGSDMAKWTVNYPSKSVVVIERTNTYLTFQMRLGRTGSVPDTAIIKIVVELPRGAIETNWNKTFPFVDSAVEVTGSKPDTYVKTSMAATIPGARIIL